MEEDVQMLELSSPTNSSRTYTKRDNKIKSSPHSSKVTANGDGNNITNLFVVNPQARSKSHQTSPIASTSKRHETISPRKSDSISETQGTSQLSDDVFLTDRKTSIDSPSKADSKSYKDRIKDRFQMIKENAGKSSQKAGFKDAGKKLIMERIRQDNADIEAEIRLKKKKFEGRITDRQKIYDFFVGENGPVEGYIQDTENTTEGTERNVDGSTELLVDRGQKDVDILIEFRYPELLRFQEKISEHEWLFKPSGNPVGLSKKIDGEPRYLEDVPVRPEIPERHMNILEERLLGVNDKKWFNGAGKLNIIENPANNSSLRPPEHQSTTDKNLTIFAKPILDTSECQEVLVIKENILQVHLKNIKFAHHPLFSLEHVLERQLMKTCEKYEKYMENNTLKKISNQLEASRHTLINFSNISGDTKRDKPTQYKKEIKELRESMFVQGKEERHLLKLALSLWKNIKKLRIKNGYSNTSIKLIINKELLDLHTERKVYEDNLQKAYQEIIGEYKQEFKNKMRAYKKVLQEMQKSPRSESDATTIESPKKPTYNVDEESVFKQLKTRFEESFRIPGEPFVRFAIKHDNPITDNVDNTREIVRRNLVSSSKIYLKIVCNKLTVCKTKIITLDNNFDCSFNETISILLTNIPKFITIILVEQTNALQKRTIAEVNLNVPNPSSSHSKLKNREEIFEKVGIVQYKHEGVGSGIHLIEELEKNDLNVSVKIEDFELNTSGSVFYTSFWENPVKENTAGNVEVDSELDSIIDKYGAVQVDKLAEWVSENNLDPMNPKNTIIYEYIQGFDESVSVLNKKKYFRLNPYQKCLEFCDISEIDNNIRMKILQLRNQNEPEFDGMLVPNRVKEIPHNIFQGYRRRIAHEREGIFSEDDEEEDYNSKRKIGKNNLKQIYVKIFQKCKSASNNLELEDVLDEKYLVHFERFMRTLSTNFFNWFRWKPQISHPLPELKKTNVEKIQTNDREISSLVRITIKVLSGLNIPERDSAVRKKELLRTDQSPSDSTVKSFVEVRYNGIFDRTKAVEGTHPIWNEELSLVLNPSHFDYLNPDSLSGSILISVFDEIEQNVQLKDIKTRNWLGSFEAPFSAICTNSGMEGNFKLNLPNVMFGYIKAQSKTTANQNMITTQSYLNLNFSVQPNISKLTPSIEELPSSDLPYIRDYIIKWNESYNHSFPLRKFSALAINSSGKTTCLVRYIKPLEPPQLNNEGFDVEPDQCAKYVSLIPFTNCNYFYQNVWLSTDQLLHLLTGSIIDHAVALTCFLLALKLDVWLLLGFGIPYGSTAFVLFCEQSKETELPLYYIYDVVTGEKIAVLDPFCPLQRIYCIIRDQNIWANIQRNDNVALTRFDLSRRSDWLPLFNTDISAPTNSVQNPVTYVPKQNADELEIQLERKIRKLISKLRPLDRTIWNKRISNIIKNNIHLLDYVYMHGRSNVEICNELCRNMSDYDVSGYVLNLPYTNLMSIIKKIKTIGVYFQESSDIEFTLAVQFSIQPGYIASVWIFLASVKEK